MLNKYLEDAFKLSRKHMSTFEEVKRDWGDGCALINFFHDGGYPFNVDTYNWQDKKSVENKNYKIKLALFYESGGEVFKDEEEYRAEKKTCFASEAVIPCGTMPLMRNGKRGEENSRIIFHGKIVSVERVVLDDVKSLHIVFTCQGQEYDHFVDEGIMPFAEVGNIICAVFDAQGLLL